MTTADDVREDIEAADNESDYTAVNTLWLALLKLANGEAGSTEEARMKALVLRIPAEEVKAIVNFPAVDTLLDLEPPLESVSVNKHERSDSKRAREEIAAIKAHRIDNPTLALIKLGSLLKRIRNKREHAFKRRQDERDANILGAARIILDALCRSAFAHATGG